MAANLYHSKCYPQTALVCHNLQRLDRVSSSQETNEVEILDLPFPNDEQGVKSCRTYLCMWKSSTECLRCLTLWPADRVLFDWRAMAAYVYHQAWQRFPNSGKLVTSNISHPLPLPLLPSKIAKPGGCLPKLDQEENAWFEIWDRGL